MCTYTKLREGDWGIRSSSKPKIGEQVTVTKRDGNTKSETVKAILWQGPDRTTGRQIWLCSIEQRERASGGYRCSACGHDGDECADLDCTCYSCGGMMR